MIAKKFVDLAIDIQNERLKLYGPQINSFYTPMYAEGSLSLIEVSCLLILFFWNMGSVSSICPIIINIIPLES